MSGIPKQGGSTISPLRNRITVSRGPTLPTFGQINQLTGLGANVFEITLNFFGAAFGDAPFFNFTAVKSHHHVVLLAPSERVVHQVAVGTHPNAGSVPLQRRWEICFVHHRAVHHMAGDAMRVAHQLGPHHRLHAIGCHQGLALVSLTVLIDDADKLVILFDGLNSSVGMQRHLPLCLHSFEQCGVRINPVNHGIGVAKAFSKGVASGDVAHLVFIKGIVHHHVVGVDRPTAGLFADTKCIESMKGVWTQLHARTNLANLRGLLQHFDFKALLGQRQSSCQAANAASCYQHRKR